MEVSNVVAWFWTFSISWKRLLLQGCHAEFPYSKIGITNNYKVVQISLQRHNQKFAL